MLPLTELHLEPTNICTLQCPGCARTRFIEQWPTKWRNSSVDVNEVMRFLDIDLRNRSVFMCGNYGDPIYHPDLAGLVRAFHDRGAKVRIVTNGGHRKKSWWQGLCAELGGDDEITFSIDGTPENFHQYRINGDWRSTEVGIQTCVAHGIRTVWKYIPFSYNQNNIEQAQELSQELGMTDFVVEHSDRFDERTQHLIPVKELVAQRGVAQAQLMRGHGQAVDPDCHRAGNTYFITANGHFSMCCYLADHRFYYKTDFGRRQDQYDIRTTTFSEITSRADVVRWYQNIPESPFWPVSTTVQKKTVDR